MAQDNTMKWIIMVLAAVVVINIVNPGFLTGMFGGAQTPPPAGGAGTATSTGVDLSALIDGTVTFTGSRAYLAGTALTAEYVRVIEKNGEKKDRGTISLNSGTLSASPKKKFDLTWFWNATSVAPSANYYAYPETYVYPSAERDTKSGIGYLIDTAPTISIFDEYGQVQTSAANLQALGADDVKTVTLRIRAASDKAYGNPAATLSNAVCFSYNTTHIQNVETNTGSVSAPYAISSEYSKAGAGLSCYNLPKVADLKYEDVPVTIKATSSEPGTYANISVYTDDIAYDLNADTLDGIWGFQDEDNNALGDGVETTTIYIS